MRKSIQQMLLLAACAAVPSVTCAATLSVDEAKDVAAEFFQSGDVLRLADRDAFELAHTAVDKDSNPICYVFNARDGKGFVIVSADDSSLPVIGYSDVSSWDVSSVPDFAGQLLFEPVKVSADTRRRVLAKASSKQASKLLSTPEWSQEAPFNNMIPNRRLTGCVGVALAEILKYHEFPVNRPASLAGNDGIAYDWDDMLTGNYRSGYTQTQADAVAALVADAAIGIGTDFGMSSSSAYEVKVPYALTSLFGYDAGVSYKKRQEMDRDAWDQVIVDEIDADRPVLYCGQDVSAGHAFVVDGYQMQGSVPYFHINWGWGGSANAYFATNALNPVVSKAHSYNDLMTIVYNIKPAADNTKWSDLHITSDGKQVGLTMDVTDITSVSSFLVRVGAIKNISNTDFNGKLSVALFGADGQMKCLLNDGRNFSLWALQINNFVDFSCSVPTGTSVEDGDVVRMVAQSSFTTEWLPVSGDGLAPGHVPAKNNEIPYFNVKLPASSDDALVTAADSKVIKGRDYVFSVVPASADKVVTVKANGFILTPDANNGYRLSNVLEDQVIVLNVQNASDVLSKKTLWVTAGNLQNLISDNEASTVIDLTLFGTINANDFTFMRDRMKLERLDISQVSIVAVGSNPANAIPAKAFQNYTSLREIYLPGNLTTLKNGCFNRTSLRTVEIPASVGTWEYNVFLSCGALTEVVVRRQSPAWINWCVFTGTPRTKLVVPVGSKAAYAGKEYWDEFKEIIEQDAVNPGSYKVSVAEQKGIKFNAVSEGVDFASGSDYRFTAEADESFGDATMHVYANTTRLTPDASGMYTAKVNANTLIHFEFSYPEETTSDKNWFLTGADGGVGLVTDVVNVAVGKAFTVRANAIKIPNGAEASKFYAVALTDKDGAIKEIISPVFTNSSTNYGNIAFNFTCQVNEASIKSGNELRLITSYNKKTWNTVNGDAKDVTDRIPVIGNQVAYHSVNMPQSVTGAKLEGYTTQVVRGMPLNIKVTPLSPLQRATVSVNGVNKAVAQSVANVSIPSVTEDLEITVSIHDLGASEFTVVNVQEGELATKIADCPARLKLMGTILVEELAALRAKYGNIVDLDMYDLTIKGSESNTLPTNAFAPTAAGGTSMLSTVILPKNLVTIADNAFNRCASLKEVTIPASVKTLGSGAFSTCSSLKKITCEGNTPPATNMNPFPSNASDISLEVPRGYDSAYSNASYWSSLTLTIPTYYYWIKYDPTRVFVYTSAYGDGSKIAVAGSKVQVNMGLPNCRTGSKPEAVKNYRDGQVFRLYDNGNEVTSEIDMYTYESGGVTYYSGGTKLVIFDPTLTNVNANNYPRNHAFDVIFYYPIVVEALEGAEGIQSEIIVDSQNGGERFNAPMSRFFRGDTSTKVTYKEDKNYYVRLTHPNPNVNLAVKVEYKIMTKPGVDAEYEYRTFDVYANEDGLYELPALPGDAKVMVSGSIQVAEGEPLPSEDLSAVSKEDVAEFTELTVTGELDETAFEAIKDKFEALETLDLSGIENESIPAGAFEGMSQLKEVVLPPTVTEIGENAFKDCDNIETLSLPGVTSIGEGAFEGCDHLTSLLLPSVSGGGASAKPGMKKAGEVDGVNAGSFRGLSPNCLIYIGENEIPGTEALNIILNKGSERVAASDIILDGNHAFNAPASFNLGDYKVSFTTQIVASDSCDVDGGWKTLILPFRPTAMEIGEEYAERAGSGIHIVSFSDNEAEALTAQSTLLPNVPYLANVCAPFKSVPVTFSATARAQAEGEETVYDVPFTPVPEETVAVGKRFSLYGSFDGETRNVDYLVLNDEASAFVAPTEGVDKVIPFSAYLVANDGMVASEMAVGEHPVWVHEPASAAVGGTRLYRSSKIELVAPGENTSIYYTLDGSDPMDSEGTRTLFSAPFSMGKDGSVVKAVAEYKGNYSDVVELDFELKTANIEFDLKGNWNWISHFSENPIKVADFITEGIDGIISQTQELIVDRNYGIVGTLKELLPAQGYKVSIDGNSWTGSVSGIAFDPAASISLNEGWTWIGTPVDEGSLAIEDLLADIDAEEGDMLVGIDGFVQADADGIWKGTLSHMVPGAAYMLFSNSAKDFVYNIVPVHDDAAPVKAPVAAADGYWTVDNHRYAFAMPVIASLEDINGGYVDADDYVVAAFCGDECRGIGAVVDGLVMINIHGNAGDLISFRFMTEDGIEMESATSVSFVENPKGTFARPFAISVGGSTNVEAINLGSLGIAYEDGSFIFSGDFSEMKAVEVYDLSGKLIARSAGERKIGVGDIAGSVVTVVIRKTDSVSSAKVVVK